MDMLIILSTIRGEIKHFFESVINIGRIWSFSGERVELLTPVAVSSIHVSSFSRGNRNTLVEGILEILNTVLDYMEDKYLAGKTFVRIKSAQAGAREQRLR